MQKSHNNLVLFLLLLGAYSPVCAISGIDIDNKKSVLEGIEQVFKNCNCPANAKQKLIQAAESVYKTFETKNDTAQNAITALVGQVSSDKQKEFYTNPTFMKMALVDYLTNFDQMSCQEKQTLVDVLHMHAQQHEQNSQSDALLCAYHMLKGEYFQTRYEKASAANKNLADKEQAEHHYTLVKELRTNAGITSESMMTPDEIDLVAKHREKAALHTQWAQEYLELEIMSPDFNQRQLYCEKRKLHQNLAYQHRKEADSIREQIISPERRQQKLAEKELSEQEFNAYKDKQHKITMVTGGLLLALCTGAVLAVVKGY